MSSKKVLVIGGGPAGYPAAIKAAQLGCEVSLIEKKTLGGVCINEGCIPTKTLMYSTNIYSRLKKDSFFGISAKSVTLNLPLLMKRKVNLIKQLVNGIEVLVKRNGITLLKGTASFLDPNTVEILETGDKIQADYIILATGSKPKQLSIENGRMEKIMNSDETLEINSVPSSILIVGGGVVGIEFAQLFHMMNCKVTLVEMMPQILPVEDHEISRGLKELLEKDGIEIYTNVTIKNIRDVKEGSAVTIATEKGEKEIRVEKVVSAIGRRPCFEDLKLEKIGVRIEDGKVIVDDHMKTNINGIYAAGDVIGGWMLAHIATAEGICAAINIVGGDKKINYRAVPRCVYTTPEVAAVGLSENEAREKYDISVGRFPFNANGKALILNDTFGMVKIIADRKYGEILGVHILGPHATELINEVALAIKMEIDCKDLADAIHAHPTVSEAIMEAALDVNKESIHLPPKTLNR